MSWSVGELAEQCAGRLRGPPDARVDSFSIDTRTLAPGALFVAIRGDRFDGHDFVAAALRAGAAAALVEREPGPGVSGPTITVDDTVEALGRLAASHRARFRGPVVAITGSNGKTTTKEMCASILSAAGARARKSAGNLNNHLGLPLSVLTLRDADEALVVELGMSHAGEIEKLARIAEPTVGAITNIAAAHLGPLGSIEAIARAKGELFERIRPDGVAVINADDARCVEQAARFGGRQLSFGHGEDADFRVRDEVALSTGERFVLETEAGWREITLAAPGAHLVEDAACAATTAFATGLLGADPLSAIAAGLERFDALPGRLARQRTPGGASLLDDSYNANPRSLEAALAALARLRGGGRTLAVLGDMLELGNAESELHADAGRAAAASGVDVLIAVGEQARHAAEAAAAAGVGETHHWPDSETAAARVSALVREGDTVLVKGSRGMHMERVVAALMETT